MFVSPPGDRRSLVTFEISQRNGKRIPTILRDCDLRSIFHACVRGDPIHLPGLPSILRESLFKTAGIWSDVRYNKSYKDSSAIQRFLIEKLAPPILELTDRGWAQGAVAAVGKIEAPLVGSWIVETQGRTLNVTGWAFDLKFHQISAATPHLSDNRSAFIFGPGGRAGKWMRQAGDVSFPITNLEVEIVLPISLPSSGLRSGGGGDWGRLWKRWRGIQ